MMIFIFYLLSNLYSLSPQTQLNSLSSYSYSHTLDYSLLTQYSDSHTPPHFFSRRELWNLLQINKDNFLKKIPTINLSELTHYPYVPYVKDQTPPFYLKQEHNETLFLKKLNIDDIQYLNENHLINILAASQLKSAIPIKGLWKHGNTFFVGWSLYDGNLEQELDRIKTQMTPEIIRTSVPPILKKIIEISTELLEGDFCHGDFFPHNLLMNQANPDSIVLCDFEHLTKLYGSLNENGFECLQCLQFCLGILFSKHSPNNSIQALSRSYRKKHYPLSYEPLSQFWKYLVETYLDTNKPISTQSISEKFSELFPEYKIMPKESQTQIFNCLNPASTSVIQTLTSLTCA